jgi:multisubunit Na+/H+ antiporter MnhF subunit
VKAILVGLVLFARLIVSPSFPHGVIGVNELKATDIITVMIEILVVGTLTYLVKSYDKRQKISEKIIQ